jgi:SAM-dependent methyltransferase
VAPSRTFEQLVAEGESAPVDGWDFSWFDGRATEQRPSWGYARMLRTRLPEAEALLDVQTGGGEVLAEVLGQLSDRPVLVVASEGWPANATIAQRNLAPFGGTVVRAADRAGLPFAAGSFDLVVSRHPTVVLWEEIGRVLRPGGTYLAQLIGPGSQRELYEFLMGPRQPPDPHPRQRVSAMAAAAGLAVLDFRHESLPTVFHDIGSVVYFLRKVVWIVPDFTVDRYRHRLAALHDRILADGSFMSHAQRMLVEARKPPAG